MMELYGDQIRDLLRATAGAPAGTLRIREDAKNHNTFVQGLHEVSVDSLDEAMAAIAQGSEERSVAGL